VPDRAIIEYDNGNRAPGAPLESHGSAAANGFRRPGEAPPPASIRQREPECGPAGEPPRKIRHGSQLLKTEIDISQGRFQEKLKTGAPVQQRQQESERPA